MTSTAVKVGRKMEVTNIFNGRVDSEKVYVLMIHGKYVSRFYDQNVKDRLYEPNHFTSNVDEAQEVKATERDLYTSAAYKAGAKDFRWMEV